MSNSEKTPAAFIEDQEQKVKNILGYGQKLKVFIGKNEKNEDEFKEYHFCPVSLSDIPDLTKSLNEFGKTAKNKNWTKESLETVAKIIQLSLKRAHGEIQIDTLLNEFDFGSLAKAVRIAINVNDFLSEMQTIQQTFETMDKMDKK